jgi:hypothetical protein
MQIPQITPQNMWDETGLQWTFLDQWKTIKSSSTGTIELPWTFLDFNWADILSAMRFI